MFKMTFLIVASRLSVGTCMKVNSKMTDKQHPTFHEALAIARGNATTDAENGNVDLESGGGASESTVTNHPFEFTQVEDALTDIANGSDEKEYDPPVREFKRRFAGVHVEPPTQDIRTRARARTEDVRIAICSATKKCKPYRKYCDFITNLVTVLGVYNFKFKQCMEKYEEWQSNGTNAQKLARKAEFEQEVVNQQITKYRDAVNSVVIAMYKKLEPLTKLTKWKTMKQDATWFKVSKVLLVVCKIAVKVAAMNADSMFDGVKLANAFLGKPEEDGFEISQWLKEVGDIGEDCNTVGEEIFGQGLLETITGWWANVTTRKEFRDMKQVQQVLNSLDELVTRLCGYVTDVRAACGTDELAVPQPIIATMDIFESKMTLSHILPEYHPDVENDQNEALTGGLDRALSNVGHVKDATDEHGQQLETYRKMFVNLTDVVRGLCNAVSVQPAMNSKLDPDWSTKLDSIKNDLLITRLLQSSVPDATL